MQNGWWLLLDELNLAPPDVLEALNRVLDDNRELFIAETGEVIKAHPRFQVTFFQFYGIKEYSRHTLSDAFLALKTFVTKGKCVTQGMSVRFGGIS